MHILMPSSTSRHTIEHNIPIISSAVNPYQPYIADTITSENSTRAPACPSTGYPHPNMWIEPTFQIETINYNYTNIPTSIYLGTSSSNIVTYRNINMSELQGTRLIFIYSKSVMTNIEQHRYQQAQFGEQPLQYIEQQVQFEVLREQPAQPIEQNMENTEHSESYEPENEHFIQITIPFDTLFNVATSIIENTDENNLTVTSGMNIETNTHIPSSDLITLSNTALFSLEDKTDIALDFNILDYILGEGNQMTTSVPANTANSSISTTLN